MSRCKVTPDGHFKGDHDAAHADIRPPNQRNRLALQAGVRTELRNTTISSAFSLKATKKPTMRAHSLIVLVSAALVAAGVIGLGAHIYNYSRAPVTEVEPLFARSVEQAGLPASHWRTERLDVPYYGPMVELLTLGASASRATTDQRQPATAPAPQARRAPAGAEQTRQSRRAKAERATNDVRSSDVDPRDAYARGDASEKSRDRRSSRAERRSQERDAQKRQAAPSEGFTPFHMFGIFNSR